MNAPRIALIHAVQVAVDPIRQAFSDGWPEAATYNLLEDSLSPDRAKDPDLTEEMSERIGDLARYAAKTGADAVLFTCSAFGPAIEAVARELPLPVLKPNEAMFELALGFGTRIGMVATFGPAVSTMEAEFHEEVGRRGIVAELRTELVADAMTALRTGDAETHNRLVARTASQVADCDAVMLAHFSTARAAPAVRKAVTKPVLTSPDAAVAKLKSLLLGV